jgi:hypothetical protein
MLCSTTEQIAAAAAAAAGGRGRRGRRTLESTSGTSKLTLGNKRLLLGLPKDDWTRPPSYVGTFNYLILR